MRPTFERPCGEKESMGCRLTNYLGHKSRNFMWVLDWWRVVEVVMMGSGSVVVENGPRTITGVDHKDEGG